jgi:hypothetical protein
LETGGSTFGGICVLSLLALLYFALHLEGRFIVHDLTSSSIEIHVSGFYPVVAACSVLLLSFEPVKAEC